MPAVDFPSHVAWLSAHRGQALRETLVSDEIRLSVPDALHALMEADPSPNKIATQWLCDTYIDRGFRWEDIAGGQNSKAANTLRAFGTYRKKLPEGSSNLRDYKTLGQVHKAIAPFLAASSDAVDVTASGKALRRQERQKALDESIIVHKSERMIIAVPLTQEASCWWGKGTQWCTAAENDNAFHQYNKEAPLLVLIIDGKKYQLWVTRDDIQFTDEHDETVSDDFVVENWGLLHGLITWSVEQHGLALRLVPENHRTEDLCRLAVQQYGRALEYVPENHRTEDLCRLAVQQNGIALTYVPESRRTEKICCLAVQQNGIALSYVAESRRTEEICHFAVSQNGRALSYVPESLRTEEICRLAVQQDWMALGYVPDHLRTEDLCRLAVQHDGRALAYVPENLQTEEICRLAVQQDGIALDFVPENLRTKEIYRLAVQQNGIALHYVPESLRTEEIRNLAVYHEPSEISKDWNDEMQSENSKDWNNEILDGLVCHIEIEELQHGQLYTASP